MNWKIPAALLVVALAYPLVFRGNFAINFGVLVLFFALIGQAWNIAGGFGGQLSFGHAVFFGTGSYFALITLAFAEAFRILTNALEFTGGGVGLLLPLKRSALNFQFAERIGFYYTILALTAISIGIAIWLQRSRFGARLAAIRENEDAARALGIDTFREKVKVMALSGALCALGGTFYAQYYLYIDPAVVFGVDKSVEMLLVSMIGGAGPRDR